MPLLVVDGHSLLQPYKLTRFSKIRWKCSNNAVRAHTKKKHTRKTSYCFVQATLISFEMVYHFPIVWISTSYNSFFPFEKCTWALFCRWDFTIFSVHNAYVPTQTDDIPRITSKGIQGQWPSYSIYHHFLLNWFIQRFLPFHLDWNF